MLITEEVGLSIATLSFPIKFKIGHIQFVVRFFFCEGVGSQIKKYLFTKLSSGNLDQL